MNKNLIKNLGIIMLVGLFLCTHVNAQELSVLKAKYETIDTFVSPPEGFEPNGDRDVVISVTYNGFSTPAQNAFQYAVDIWASLLESNVPIIVDATFGSLDEGVLGSAGADAFFADFTNAPLSNTYYPVALANKFAGFDLDPGFPDISANFNSDTDWYYGTDGNPGPGQFDFVSVVLHELGHGLGFVGSATVSGNTGSYGLGSDPIIYDTFAEINTGMDILDFANNSTSLGNALKGGNLFWFGPAAVAANGGNDPELYAPSTWEGGSSFSHWDEDYFPEGNENSLMTPLIGFQEAIHTPGPVGLGMMEDIGWTLTEAGGCTADNMEFIQLECTDFGEGLLPLFQMVFSITGGCQVEELFWQENGGGYVSANLPDLGIIVFDGDAVNLQNTIPDALYDVYFILDDGTVSDVYSFVNGNCEVGGDCSADGIVFEQNPCVDNGSGLLPEINMEFQITGDCLVENLYWTVDGGALQSGNLPDAGILIGNGEGINFFDTQPDATYEFYFDLEDGSTSPVFTWENGNCEDEVLGCTNEFADNYNMNATVEDGSCIYSETICDCNGTEHSIGVLTWIGDGFEDVGEFFWEGQAVDFNCSDWGYDCGDIADAPDVDPFNVCSGGLPPDNGCSTTGCDGTEITVSISTDCWGEETGWTLTNDFGTVISSVPAGALGDLFTYTTDICLTEGCYTFSITDEFGDGMFGSQYTECDFDGDYMITDEDGNVLVDMTAVDFGFGTTHEFCIESTGIEGCTSPTACNYNPEATIDDGSCDFSCFGCTNPNACNFDPEATIDDGSCDFSCFGCTNPNACNFNPFATIDNGSCDFSCLGCIDPTACNFDPEATIDNGSCDYSCQGCTDSNACNFDPEATINDGSCDFSCFGCTNPEACNYDDEATVDNGSCNFSCYGCTDSGACNFDPENTIDDGSCDYSCLGCTDPTATNFDPTATIDDGSCIYGPIFGCTDSNACNFDSFASDDDGSCEYDSCSGCTDPIACNYDSTATISTDTCDYISCAGCTDATACNYDSTATLDDGSCDFEICAGCMDSTACNFDSTATIDDGSCEFETCAGCTDSAAINYNADATIDDGSCVYDCEYPSITYETFCVDGENESFYVEMAITSLGNGAPYTISNNQNGEEISLSFNGTVNLGPFDNDQSVVVTVESDLLAGCFLTSPVLSDNCTVNIEELAAFDFEMYPNPNTGTFYIETVHFEGPAVIAAYDIAGRLIYSSNEMLMTNTPLEISLDGNLAHGSYTIEIQTTKGMIRKQMIKH